MAPRTRRPGTRLVTGLAELDAALSEMKLGAANKIARPALTKAARHLLKVIKGKVPPNMKNAKRALGMVVNAKGGKSKNEQQAKVGAAVGKASKAEPKKSSSGGVGISGRNIHWFLLGTEDRQTKSGKSTGAMPPQMPGLIRDATSSEKSQIESIIRSEVATRLAALAAKSK